MRVVFVCWDGVVGVCARRYPAPTRTTEAQTRPRQPARQRSVNAALNDDMLPVKEAQQPPA